MADNKSPELGCDMCSTCTSLSDEISSLHKSATVSSDNFLTFGLAINRNTSHRSHTDLHQRVAVHGAETFSRILKLRARAC